MTQRELRIAAILFEHGYKARTPEETARFANLLNKQMARDRLRQHLRLAEYELDFARKVVDDPTIPYAEAPPTVESVEADKAAEIAASERLMGYAAQAARQVLHAFAYTSASEDAAVSGLAAVLLENAPAGVAAAFQAEEFGFVEWQLLARAAIVYLGTPKDGENG